MMNIVLAQSKDCEAILSLIHNAIRRTPSRKYNIEQREAWIKRFDLFALQNLMESFHYYIAIKSGTSDILGVIGIQPLNGFIHSLFVAPEYQHQGVASTLFDFAEEIFESQQVHSITVEASHMALSFFKSKGFKIFKTNLVDINGILLENFTMEKDLSS